MTSENSTEVLHEPRIKDDPAQTDDSTTLIGLTGRILENENLDHSTELLAATYREQDEFEDSDSDASGFIVEPAPHEEEVVEDAKTKKFGHTVKGEITLDDLPRVEKLQISVEKNVLVHVGNLCSSVDCLVVVESTGDHPVLNIDTALFLEDGRAVGLIFDVIGPVKRPYYILRFNNCQEIADEHLEEGTKIFFATGHERTYFVFEKQIKELMQIKGSDASWEHDIEPPEHELDYSNDEDEKAAKQERRAKRNLSGQPVDRRPANGNNNDNGRENNSYPNRRRSRPDVLGDETPASAGQCGLPGAGPRRQRPPHVRNNNSNNNRNFRQPNPMMMANHHNIAAVPPPNFVMPYTQAFPPVPPGHNPWAMTRPVHFQQAIFPQAQMPPSQAMYNPGPNMSMYNATPYMPAQFPPGVQYLPGAQLAQPLYMTPPPTNPPPGHPYPGPYQQGQAR